MHAVPLQRHEVTGYYDGFCNSLLWPLFHGRLQRLELNRSWWRTYRAVNQRFALTVARVAPPERDGLGPRLPPAARAGDAAALAGATCGSGSFLHIPFPPAQLFAALPWRREILLGMLAADLIGFQTQDDVDNFTDSVDRLVRGVRGRRERVTGIPADAFPISVDFDQWSASGDRAAVAGSERRRELDADVVFLGVDRLDYTKGIANRLARVRRAARPADGSTRRPPCSCRSPCPAGTTSRATRRSATRSSDSCARSTTGTAATTARNRSCTSASNSTRPHLAEWYRAADCLVVTSLADGMNLVAKEFVACRSDLRGSVILSEFAGAANDLPGAMVVNPYDVEAIEKAMLQARRRCRSTNSAPA